MGQGPARRRAQRHTRGRRCEGGSRGGLPDASPAHSQAQDRAAHRRRRASTRRSRTRASPASGGEGGEPLNELAQSALGERAAKHRARAARTIGEHLHVAVKMRRDPVETDAAEGEASVPVRVRIARAHRLQTQRQAARGRGADGRRRTVVRRRAVETPPIGAPDGDRASGRTDRRRPCAVRARRGGARRRSARASARRAGCAVREPLHHDGLYWARTGEALFGVKQKRYGNSPGQRTGPREFGPNQSDRLARPKGASNGHSAAGKSPPTKRRRGEQGKTVQEWFDPQPTRIKPGPPLRNDVRDTGVRLSRFGLSLLAP